jgi:hypothetical protein
MRQTQKARRTAKFPGHHRTAAMKNAIKTEEAPRSRDESCWIFTNPLPMKNPSGLSSPQNPFSTSTLLVSGCEAGTELSHEYLLTRQVLKKFTTLRQQAEVHHKVGVPQSDSIKECARIRCSRCGKPLRPSWVVRTRKDKIYHRSCFRRLFH